MQIFLQFGFLSAFKFDKKWENISKQAGAEQCQA
jgi:hypothetical protein